MMNYVLLKFIRRTEFISHDERCITVDREIFAIKIFSPVAYAAKIKHTKISYVRVQFLPLGHVVKINAQTFLM